MAKVLIDRELLRKWLYRFTIEAQDDSLFALSMIWEIKQAIKSAPPAVIPIEKAHDCSKCLACVGNWCGEMTCWANGKKLNGENRTHTAPDDCPQICKE
jgi:hypothetical protein